jgi:hypothetical protein
VVVRPKAGTAVRARKRSEQTRPALRSAAGGRHTRDRSVGHRAEY